MRAPLAVTFSRYSSVLTAPPARPLDSREINRAAVGSYYFVADRAADRGAVFPVGYGDRAQLIHEPPAQFEHSVVVHNVDTAPIINENPGEPDI